jgi:hypothetical protein
MKKTSLLLAALLSGFLPGCVSPPPPRAYRSTDSSALIIQSLDARSAQVLAPKASNPADANLVLGQAKTLAPHNTAVVILENYSEPQLGHEFRDRSMVWFLGLRGLGYQHIVFVRGSGVHDPNGLPLLAQYD